MHGVKTGSLETRSAFKSVDYIPVVLKEIQEIMTSADRAKYNSLLDRLDRANDNKRERVYSLFSEGFVNEIIAKCKNKSDAPSVVLEKLENILLDEQI
jgi:hypothetical protein